MGSGIDRVLGGAVGNAGPRLGPRAGHIADGVGTAARADGLAGLDRAATRFGDLAEKVGRARPDPGVSQAGWWSLPEVGDEVLVAFDHGDDRKPFVVGSLWNGMDVPPVGGSGGKDAPGWEGKAARLADGAGAYPGLRGTIGKVRAMAETIGGIRDLQRDVHARRS